MTERIGHRMLSVYKFLVAHPGKCRRDVAEALGMPPSSASSAVARAVKAGLVREGKREGRAGHVPLFALGWVGARVRARP